jgi:hypothetical protein
VRDGGAERALSGRLRIDVDPLMVVRCLGEEVDLALVDRLPLARAEVAQFGGQRLVASASA